MYRCRICSEEWEAIPDHAVLLNKRGVNHVYRFSDNTVHILYRARPISADHRWHKTPRPDCLFCNPSAEPEKLPEPSSPVAEQLSQEVIQVLDKLPESEIIVEEVVAEIEGEVEVPTTAMAAAFSRIKS